ncbi:MAG: histidine kinase N-terminal 7TM domain-containing protein, partial [Planctomycetota bacterium]
MSRGWWGRCTEDGILGPAMRRNEILIFAIVFTLATIVAVGAVVSWMHNPHGLFPFLAAGISMTVGITAWILGPARRLARLFLLMCASISSYSIMLFFQTILPDEETVVSLTRLSSVGYYFIAPTTLHFALEVARLRQQRQRIAVFFFYSLAVMFFLGMVTGIFPLEFTHSGTKFSLVISHWYLTQLGITAGTFAYMLIELLRRFLTLEKGLLRTQIGWFLGSAFITILLAFTNPLASTALKTYPMGGIGGVFFASVLAYLVVKHRFLDVQFVLRRTFFWVLWTSAVAGTYALILVGFGLFMEVRPLQSQLPNLVAILLAAFLLLPLRDAVQNLVDRKFFRARYDARKTLEELSAKVVAILNVEDLSREILETVANTFQSGGARLLLADRRTGRLEIAAEKLADKPFRFVGEKERDALLTSGPWTEKVLQVDPEKRAPLPDDLPAEARSFFDERGIEVSLPLASPEGVEGVLLLGVKRSEMAYTAEDLG